MRIRPVPAGGPCCGPMSMRVELLVTANSVPCRKAIDVWRTVCDDHGHTLDVVDDHSPEGRRAIADLDLKALPAVLIGGRLVAVGVQSPEQALHLLSAARELR